MLASFLRISPATPLREGGASICRDPRDANPTVLARGGAEPSNRFILPISRLLFSRESGVGSIGQRIGEVLKSASDLGWSRCRSSRLHAEAAFARGWSDRSHRVSGPRGRRADRNGYRNRTVRARAGTRSCSAHDPHRRCSFRADEADCVSATIALMRLSDRLSARFSWLRNS